MFDGIMCTTDMLAVASEVAVEKYGLRVPEDIKITGYDDTTDYFTSEKSRLHRSIRIEAVWQRRLQSS